MKVFSTLIKSTNYSNIIDFTPADDTKLLYIDIETTGFSRKNDMIYLIGLLYFEEDELILTQFLCEKLSDEYELLYKLNQMVTNFDQLIHFNGDSFDLPFIIERMKLYRIKENISYLKSLDFLKLLRPFKKVMATDNLKLKTMEKLAGYQRIDPFSGGELIQLYKMYLEGEKCHEKSFIQHNEEDMIGLYYLNLYRPLISLVDLPINEEAFTLSEDNDQIFVNIKFSTPENFYKINVDRGEFKLSLKNHGLSIKFPLVKGEFKIFFDNYKDYYYLVEEDYAIHESMASFVQSKYKKKANKHTAYTKRDDIYIKCPIARNKAVEALEALGSVYIFSETINDSFVFFRIEDFIKYFPLLYKHIFKNIAL